MKKLELQKFGVEEMNTEEITLLNGGSIGLPSFLKGSIVSYLATQVIANWTDIKAGFAAGYNSKY